MYISCSENNTVAQEGGVNSNTGFLILADKKQILKKQTFLGGTDNENQKDNVFDSYM